MFLYSGGRRGYFPEWAEEIVAARYLGCTPWELQAAPAGWLEKALVMRSAEIWAENERDAHSMAMAQASAGRGRARVH